MQILSALIIMAMAAFLISCYAGGYPNTIDAIAYRLHVHAARIRRMHLEREKLITARWVKCLEGDVE